MKWSYADEFDVAFSDSSLENDPFLEGSRRNSEKYKRTMRKTLGTMNVGFRQNISLACAI
jgi:hypothetical protein